MPDKNIKVIAAGVFVLFLIFVLSGGVFTVEEGEQAVVTQFGKPIGETKTESGLYLKIPFINEVHLFEKRLIRWDGAPNQIPTKAKKYIWVDTTARWKIVDALKFMQSIGTEERGQSRLDDVIDAVVRDNISSNTLIEVVRSTNHITDSKEENKGGKLKSISEGRLKITDTILQAARNTTKEYGIDIIDFRIKRINYVRSVQEEVFKRMISERNRIAAEFRSEGEGRKAEIIGNMEKELEQVRSVAYRESQKIKGKADAYVTKLFGDVFSQDPEFYAFVKTLDIYKEFPGKSTTLILSTDSAFFRYLNGP